MVDKSQVEESHVKEEKRTWENLRKMASGAAVTSIAVLLVALQLFAVDPKRVFLEMAICFSAIAIPVWVGLWYASDTVELGGESGLLHSMQTRWFWFGPTLYLLGGVSTGVALWCVIYDASSVGGWIFLGVGAPVVVALVLQLRSLENFSND